MKLGKAKDNQDVIADMLKNGNEIFNCVIVKVFNVSISVAAITWKDFGTEVHLLILILLLEKIGEWNVDIWLGLVDFEKIFDTVEHDGVWMILKKQKIN